MSAPRLVVAGNLLIDDIVFADGRTVMGEPGGAVLYVALAAALWGVPVGVVSVQGHDYPLVALEALAARGVDLTGLRPSGERALRTWLLYERAGRRVVHQLDTPDHDAVSPAADRVPEAWWDAAIVHVAPMPRAIQLGYAGRGAAARTLDPHEPLVTGDGPHSVERLRGFDGVFASHEEVRLPGAIETQTGAIPASGFVAIKRAEQGGLLLDRTSGRTHPWTARADRVVESTGAGDAFAGGFLAGRVLGDDVERCLLRGVVAASFALEAPGARGLVAADRTAAEERLARWSSTTASREGGR